VRPPRLPRARRSIIFCEAVAIYGVIVAIILQTKLEAVTAEEGLFTRGNMAAGYAIFAAGLTCGLSNLVCG
jgi:F0F1-type ATP synthase membrane subunit c/vacuolar-type H+-ATPase subunit K